MNPRIVELGRSLPGMGAVHLVFWLVCSLAALASDDAALRPAQFRSVRPNRANHSWMAEIPSSPSTNPSETVTLPLPRWQPNRVGLLEAFLKQGADAGGGPAQTPVENPSGLFTLQTGGGELLVTEAIPITFPEYLPFARLNFQYGFTTDEAASAGGLLDAFSITFQTEDASATFLILAVDAAGVVWAPPNPDGTPLAESSILRTSSGFVTNITKLARTFSYGISVRLPAQLIGHSGTLYLDLFDNQDASVSKAYVRDLSITPAFIFVDSSAQPQGPFAQESGVELDAVTASFRLPQTGQTRFYRLRGNRNTTILRMYPDADDWVFHYDYSDGPGGENGNPVLQSSAQATGPFADETGVSVDPATKLIRLQRISPARFYRLRGEVPVRVQRIEADGKRVRLVYE